MNHSNDIEDVSFRETTRATKTGATRTSTRTRRARSPRPLPQKAETRRIGLQHLAFFRGYLEGLDLSDMGAQYLEFGRDARKAAITRNWLVTAFVAAARKREDFATARLLAIRPAALATVDTAAAPAPSLDDFAAEHDPDGFHTEKDLLELFTAHHASQDADGAAGAATLRRQQRNARLRIKQMAALDALARLVVEDPKPEHHVLGWFDTAVALRLSDVGITTIGRLIDTINAVGYRWYRNVPRLGETGARRIAAWLEHYGDVDGLRIVPHAFVHPASSTLLVPQLRRDRVTGIAPIEYFLIPPELDGSAGANRNVVKNNSNAHTDLQAIEFGWPITKI